MYTNIAKEQRLVAVQETLGRYSMDITIRTVILHWGWEERRNTHMEKNVIIHAFIQRWNTTIEKEFPRCWEIDLESWEFGFIL